MKYWITINEPLSFTTGYESATFGAPAISATGYGRYLSTHTLLMAHARAYHLYDDEFRITQQGESVIHIISVVVLLTLWQCSP